LIELQDNGSVFDAGNEAVLSNYLSQINGLVDENEKVHINDRVHYAILVNDFKDIANSVHYHKI